MNDLLIKLGELFSPIADFAKDGNWKMLIMWAIGGVLIYLAIKKQMEPTLLLPIGFGAILMNFPGVVKVVCLGEASHVLSTSFLFPEEYAGKLCSECGALLTTEYSGIAEPLHELYNAGIANELFPLLLFIGIGAMIDFGPLLNNPKLMIFGAAAFFVTA